MRINAVQSYNNYNNNQNSKVNFKAFDVKMVADQVIYAMSNYIVSDMKTANSVISEAKKIFKILDEFKDARMNLWDYLDRFKGSKKKVFKTMLESMGDEAFDLPVKIENFANDTDNGMSIYILPKSSEVKCLDIFNNFKHGCGGNRITLKSGIEEHLSADHYVAPEHRCFGYYPKNVNAVKEAIFLAYDKALERPAARMVRDIATEKLRKIAGTFKNN